MGKAQFIIHSDGESLAHWLQANWQAPAGNPATAGDGLAYLQPPIWHPERRQITAGAWVTGKAAAHGPAIAEVIRLDLLPLGDGRLEVVATCEPLFDVFLADLLIEMAKRWPEVLATLGLHDLPTLRRAPAGNEEPEPGRVGLEVLAGAKTLEIAKRRQDVLELWKSRKPGTHKEQFKRETANELAVSESTIRDDLRHLEEEGLLK